MKRVSLKIGRVFLAGVVLLLVIGVPVVLGQTGTFVHSEQDFGSRNSYAVAMSDLNGDGKLDMFVANAFGQANQIWLNGGQGNFSNSQSIGSEDSKEVALGDLDGDGDVDAFVANYGQSSRVWVNNGAGSFSAASQTFPSGLSYGIALGDLNGDNKLDAFITNYGQPSQIWLNQTLTGTIIFSDTGQLLGNNDSLNVVLGDVDGDGDADAVVANYNQASQVWLNSGSGVFSPGHTFSVANSVDIGLSDLDGDGDRDVFISNYNQASTVWLNNGSGVFSLNQSLTAAASRGLKVGDVDGDGDNDAVVSNYNQASTVWLNNGAGTLSVGQSLNNAASRDVALGDVNGDGRLDAVMSNYLQSNSVWFNTLSNLAITQQVNSPNLVAGERITYTITFTNQGAYTVSGAIITDIVSSRVTNPNFSSSGVVVTSTGGSNYSWQVSKLSSNQSGVIVVSGLVDPNLGSVTVFSNTVLIASPLKESNSSNNSSTVWVTASPPPVPPSGVTVSCPSTGLVGQSYSCTAQVSPLSVTMPLTYSWSGTGQSSQVQVVSANSSSVNLSWSTPGGQSVTVTVTGASGVVMGSSSLTLNQPPTGVVINGPSSGAVNTSYTFDGVVSPLTVSQPLTYSWSPAPTSGQGTAQATYSWPTAGTYAITLSVVNAGGSLAKTYQVTLNQPPTGLVINGPSSGAVNTSYTFDGVVSPLTVSQPLTYSWSPAPTSGQGTAQATYSWPTAGTYAITLSVVNAGGSLTKTYEVTLNQPPTSLVISGTNSGLVNTSYTFDGGVSPLTVSQPLTYTWSPAPTSGQGTALATYSWPTAGTYAITLSVVNAGGSLAKTYQVTINDLATVVPTATVTPTVIATVTPTATATVTPTVTPTPSNSIIALQGVTITGRSCQVNTPCHFSSVISPSNATQPLTYTWSPNFYTTPQVTYTFATTGFHTITLTVVNEANQPVSATYTVTVTDVYTGPGIRGIVTNEAGQPIPNIYVYLENGIAWQQTDFEGKYHFELDEGIYRLDFYDWNSPRKYLPTQMTNIRVTGNVPIVANVTMTIGGHITGVVTNWGGDPQANAWVSVYAQNGSLSGSAYTDSQGQYDLSGLASGLYRVQFSNGYLREYYQDAKNWDRAKLITVTVGQVTPGIDAVLGGPSQITGLVTNERGEPVPNIGITGYWVDENGVYQYVPSTQSDATGNYSLPHLEEGSYRLDFYDWNSPRKYLPTQMTNITVTGNVTLVANVTMTTGGHITGTVTNWGGDPLANALVYVYAQDNTWSGNAYTDSQGQYDLSGLTSGLYRVQFSANSYLLEYYQDARDWNGAKLITVTAGQVTSGIDAVLGGPGQISGMVTNERGEPVPNIGITGYAVDENGVNQYISSTQSDATGNYSLPHLEDGSYRLDFYDGNWPRKYLPTQMTNISVTGNVPIVANVTMTSGGHITGTVTNWGGDPLANAWVYVYAQNGSWSGSAYTDSQGQYDLDGLTSGLYRVEFLINGYLSEYYRDTIDSSKVTSVTVTAGRVTSGIDAVLGGPGQITGIVTNKVGIPIRNIYVYGYQVGENGVDDVYNIGVTQTDANGKYAFQNLNEGIYRLDFNDGNSPQKYAFQKVTHITVTGHTTTNVVMARYSTIAGVVTYQNGNPVSDVCVKLYQKNGTVFQEIRSGIRTDVEGQYHIPFLESGTYRVGFFRTYCPEEAYQYYGAITTTLEQADNIELQAEEIVAHINATLPNPRSSGVIISLKTPNTMERYVDHVTGQVIIRGVSTQSSDVTISILAQKQKHNRQQDDIIGSSPVVCPDGESLDTNSVYLIVRNSSGVEVFGNGNPAPLPIQMVYVPETPIEPALWRATLPAGTIIGADTYKMHAIFNCINSAGISTPNEVKNSLGQFVLYDPSGYVTDSKTQKPIGEVVVTLYKVPGWQPKQTPDDNAPNTCQSHLSKLESDPWSQAAPTDKGIIVDPASPEISPNQNPQITDSIGHYKWDVAEGCWYIGVSAKGYYPKFSSVVGIPPEVKDLNLTLDPYPALQFSTSDYTVNETGQFVTVMVTSLAPVTQTVQVNYSTRDITAKAGQDYETTAGTLTFEPGDTYQTFRVRINDDTEVEDDRTVILSLSDPQNIELAARDKALLTIVSDDVKKTTTMSTYLPLIVK